MTELQNGYLLECLIIDDEPLAREGIIDYIGKMNFLKVAGTCSSAIEAATYLQNSAIDLLFLDINLPYLSGLDFLESLETPPLTILTTAYSEYALEGFRLQVVDYLLKPVSFKRFYQAALKAQEAYMARQLMRKAADTVDPYLYIRQGNGFHKIVWKDILYVEGMENYVKLHFEEKTLVIHQTMASLQNLLPTGYFFRAHKSYIVNLSHIRFIEGGRITVGNDEIPLSRQRREELMNTEVYRKLISL